ncbi:MAG: NAD(P)H-hydrate dehydratase [Aestuariibacter sp.]
MTLKTYANIFPKTSLSQNIYSADQVRHVEPRAAALAGVSMYQLMERAGKAVVDVIRRHYPDLQQVLVLAGHGNNGGDAYVVARLLTEKGCQVDVCELGQIDKLSADANEARQRWLKGRHQIKKTEQILYRDYQLCVDGMLGTGIKGAVREPYQGVIQALNKQDIAVVSIDVPSGIDSDTGTECGEAVAADHTVTFVGVKAGLVTGLGKQLCGILHFSDLGIGEPFQRIARPLGRTITFKQLKPLPPKPKAAHKGDFGKLLCIGGNIGYAGAIRLTGEAAMRSGAGLVKVFCHEASKSILASGRPELMIEYRSDYLQETLKWSQAIVIGPGLGQDIWSFSVLKQTLEHCLRYHKPVVIDADALNLMAEHRTLTVPQNLAVLTPHPGEAARLAKSDVSKVEQNRYKTVSSLSAQYDAVTVLKGAGTLIASQDNIWVCGNGNPGMATAGMGDVLSGVLGALLAQKMSIRLSAIFGVCLHSHAADLASQEYGQRGLLASDLFPYIRRLINNVA